MGGGLPFEVLDSIFQLLGPRDKVLVAVGLWGDGNGGSGGGEKAKGCGGGVDGARRRSLGDRGSMLLSSDSSGG